MKLEGANIVVHRFFFFLGGVGFFDENETVSKNILHSFYCVLCVCMKSREKARNSL